MLLIDKEKKSHCDRCDFFSNFELVILFFPAQLFRNPFKLRQSGP